MGYFIPRDRTSSRVGDSPSSARRGRRGLILALGSAAVLPLLVGSAEADDSLTTDPTLASLIAESLAVRPELARAQASAEAQRERVAQAGALADPMLQVGLQNDGFGRLQIGKMETSYYSIMASQALPWPGKRRLRGEIAELGAREARQGVARTRLATEAEVRRAYLGLTIARGRLALLARLETVWNRSAAASRARFEAGVGAQSDVLRSRLELRRIDQRRLALQADERIALCRLNRLRNHPPDEAVGTPPRIVPVDGARLRDEKAAITDALERSPELAAARLAATAADRALALARAGYFPDFVVSAAVMPRGGDFAPMWLASLGINLPVFAGRKQGRAVAESEARARAEHDNVASLEQAVRQAVREQRAALDALAETIHIYEQGLLVEAEATATSTLAEYEVGKSGFASVLEANARYIGDQDQYLLALGDAQRILIANLEVSLEPVGPSGAGAMGAGAVPGAAAADSPGGM